MAFDQNTFDDLESDIESLDETSSEDLDTSFNENELEEYGVWVKTGPEDVSPEEDEDIQLENMPASETMELTDEEDMLLGDLEENTESIDSIEMDTDIELSELEDDTTDLSMLDESDDIVDLPEMDDLSSIEELDDEDNTGDDILPAADEDAVSGETVEITDNFDDLDSEEISFDVEDSSETISDIEVEDLETGDLPEFETASSIEDEELDISSDFTDSDSPEIEEVTLTEEADEETSEISEVSLDDFTDSETSEVSLDDFMTTDESGPETEEDDEDEFLDLDLDLDDDDQLFDQEDEEVDDMDLDALIDGASDMSSDDDTDSDTSLDLDAIEDISTTEEISEDFSDDTIEEIEEEALEDSVIEEELPEMEDLSEELPSSEMELDSFDTLEDEVLAVSETEELSEEEEISDFDADVSADLDIDFEDDLSISVDIEEDDIPLDSLDELSTHNAVSEDEDNDLNEDSIEETNELPDADLELDISDLGEDATSIPGEDLLPDDVEVEMQESEEELPELNSNEYDFDDVSLDELTGGVQDVTLSELEESDVIPEEDRIDNEDLEPFAGTETASEEPEVKTSENKELSILEKIESELFSIKDELASLRSQLSTMKPAPLAAPEQTETTDESDFEGGFFDEDEDETIALTGDELDNILNNADITEEAGQPTALEDDFMPELNNEIDLSDVLEDTSAPEQHEQSEELQVFINGENAFEEVPEDEEEITSTDAETVFEDQIEDEVVAEESTDIIEEDEIVEETAAELPVNDDYEPTPEEKAIIDEYNRELDNFAEEELILEEEDSYSEVEPNVIPEDQPQDEEEFLKDTQFEDSIGEEVEVAPKDEEPVDEISLQPVSNEQEAVTDENTEMPSQLKSEIKSVLSYMDQLLESLPEDKIQEFAQSEHFEVYKKLFEELGLGN